MEITMDNSITIPTTFLIAITALDIYLLGFCFYLFKKWHKTIEASDRWEKQFMKEYMTRLKTEDKKCQCK
tara:strand:- start:44 stop:253 length:210 start_codon:yes stop_codon:yes gene_type:complete